MKQKLTPIEILRKAQHRGMNTPGIKRQIKILLQGIVDYLIEIDKLNNIEADRHVVMSKDEKVLHPIRKLEISPEEAQALLMKEPAQSDTLGYWQEYSDAMPAMIRARDKLEKIAGLESV